MFICFEEDEKRSAFPEESLISMDENGFTLKAPATRTNTVFFKMTAFKGCMQNFPQALNWIKRVPRQKAAEQKAAEKLPTNPTF